jgi:hypothetical protein
MSCRLAVLAGATLMLLAGAARAEDARLATARVAYQEQDQERTLEVLTPALPQLDVRDRAAALRLIGCAHMVLGDRAAAIAAFRDSFALEPDAALEPQLASPDARNLFEVARGEWRGALVTEMDRHAEDVKRVVLAVDAPSGSRGGHPIAIGVRLQDPAHVAARVELAYRRRGQPNFTLMTQGVRVPIGPISFSIPADATESARPFVLEYHVTVRHETGFDLRRDGDADRPLVLAVAAGHRPRWHESWWVRGAFALGVIGLGAGGYLLYRSADVGGQRVVVDRR